MSLKNIGPLELTKNQLMCVGLPGDFRTPCTTVLLEPVVQYYEFTSKPKAVGKAGVKKTTRRLVDYHNVMWDPRVFRGPVNKTGNEEDPCKKKGKPLRNFPLCYKTKKGCSKKPPPPPNHKGVQTDTNVGCVTGWVNEREMCSQTEEPFVYAVPPLYVPFKWGTDKETQIMPWELFNFGEEVKPIVASVLGKIVEQSLVEIMEETELESLLIQQRVFEEKHRMELMRLDRLQKREQRLTEERQSLITERQIEVLDEEDAEELVVLHTFLGSMFCQLAKGAVDDLRNSGFLYRENDITIHFTPWLNQRSAKRIKCATTFNSVLDAIIEHVVEEREAQIAMGMWMRLSQDFKEIRGEQEE